ncbi:hypothetical protein D928_01274 [Enterococcus faecalis 20-SD-BW-06]|nr:hypothetical protein D928_01274 [Enterococcus faecalis 20-SD-BW-06]EPI00078.1 hypothetical protein D919_02102 [Enterococcus faecalis 20-SD-BW-08]
MFEKEILDANFLSFDDAQKNITIEYINERTLNYRMIIVT